MKTLKQIKNELNKEREDCRHQLIKGAMEGKMRAEREVERLNDLIKTYVDADISSELFDSYNNVPSIVTGTSLHG